MFNEWSSERCDNKSNEIGSSGDQMRSSCGPDVPHPPVVGEPRRAQQWPSRCRAVLDTGAWRGRGGGGLAGARSSASWRPWRRGAASGRRRGLGESAIVRGSEGGGKIPPCRRGQATGSAGRGVARRGVAGGVAVAGKGRSRDDGDVQRAGQEGVREGAVGRGAGV